jgi:hypothetical protein
MPPRPAACTRGFGGGLSGEFHPTPREPRHAPLFAKKLGPNFLAHLPPIAHFPTLNLILCVVNGVEGCLVEHSTFVKCTQGGNHQLVGVSELAGLEPFLKQLARLGSQ